MALHTLIALTAVVAGGTAQDPSMDLQIAAPVLSADQGQTTNVYGVAATEKQGNKITAQFRNSKASEVLDWIEKRGVNFIVNDGDIKQDATVTLSVTDVPIEVVLDSLAAALGGHWERRDKIRVFHKGQAPVYPGFFGGQGATAHTFPTPPMPPMSMEVPAQAFKLNGKAFDAKAFDKDFEKRMKDMASEMEKKFGPEFQKKLEESMKDVKVYTFEDGAQFRALQGKEREEVMKRVEIDRKAALKDAEKMRKEAMKMAEEARKEAGQARKEALRDAERARAEGARVREEGARVRIEALKSRDINGTLFRVAPAREGRRTFITPSFPVDGMDMGKFLKSLTSSQKDTQEKRGFIRYNDLSREQKHLLGVRPDGKFEIRLKVNQDEVVVRGE